MDNTRNLSMSSHNVAIQSRIFHDSLPEHFSTLIESGYSELDKIDNAGVERDNLYNTERTGWDSHKNENVRIIWAAVAEKFATLFSAESAFNLKLRAEIQTELYDSWIAFSKDDAVVEPHNHSSCPFVWSFVFYAKIPNQKSSISFFDFYAGHITVNVKEGDLLLFPSTIGHYTSDTTPGRTVFSGNFLVSLRTEK